MVLLEIYFCVQITLLKSVTRGIILVGLVNASLQFI